MNRRDWLRRAALTTVGTGAGLGYYAWQIEPHWIEATFLDMPLRGLPPAWHGKRLVQISDLHVGEYVDHHYLCQAIGMTAELEPDVLVITGDFMTCKADEYVDRVAELLTRIDIDRQPTLAVLGNHDYGARAHHKIRDATATKLYDKLTAGGIVALRNESVELEGLQFAGTDDLWSRNIRFRNTFDDVDNSRDAIVLSHNPDVMDEPYWPMKEFPGWVLCGHTHGGQCWFPQIGAPRVPIKNHAYTAGKVAISDTTTLYVNRGIGFRHQLRFLCSPEITVFTLVPSETDAEA